MATIVNISGTGAANYCYAQVNGTKYTSAASNITLTSNTIVFEVYGNGSPPGSVTIDGNTVLTSDMGNATYSWTVPSNVTEINIVLADKSSYTTVAVTTQKAAEPHSTNIGGTAREIESGTVLIGGVLREIESGLVLVNGVAREIAFSGGVFTVTITGTGSTNYQCVEINRVIYYGPATLEVPAGTDIICFVKSQRSNNAVTVNGETVASGEQITYTHKVTSNVTVKLSFVAITAPITTEITTQ